MRFIPLFLFTVVFFSCGSKPKVVPARVDTVLVVANQQGNFKFMDSAIRVRRQIFVQKDSGSLSGELREVTYYALGQRNDTLRDSLKHIVLDAGHNPIVRFTYPQQALDTSLNKYLQVIDLPSNPLIPPTIKH